MLNKPQFHNPGILVTGHNFGAGSSREAAVWGMLANNIRVIVAKSFADIYRENCLQNGLLPVVLRPADADAFIARVVAVNGAAPFTVDLQTQTISGPGGPDIIFRYRAGRPHAAAGRSRRHRADAQAHRRDRRVREAHGERAALAADGDRQPREIVSLSERNERKQILRRKQHDRPQKTPSHHGRQEARADAGRL